MASMNRYMWKRSVLENLDIRYIICWRITQTPGGSATTQRKEKFLLVMLSAPTARILYIRVTTAPRSSATFVAKTTTPPSV